jgi:type IV pilus assembly protein PilN
MIEINLLPIRAARRKESARFQLTMVTLTFICVIIVIVVLNVSANERKQRVAAQIAMVQEQIKELEKKVGETKNYEQQSAKLDQKLAVINNLKKGRFRAAHILDELSAQIPEKIWIESLDKKGKGIKISGVALDNETIANFMDILGRSKYFTGVELEVTERVNRSGMKLMRFNLHCSTTL